MWPAKSIWQSLAADCCESAAGVRVETVCWKPLWAVRNEAQNPRLRSDGDPGCLIFRGRRYFSDSACDRAGYLTEQASNASLGGRVPSSHSRAPALAGVAVPPRQSLCLPVPAVLIDAHAPQYQSWISPFSGLKQVRGEDLLYQIFVVLTATVANACNFAVDERGKATSYTEECRILQPYGRMKKRRRLKEEKTNNAYMVVCEKPEQ